MNYYDKYLKYKNKYLNLKDQIGGEFDYNKKLLSYKYNIIFVRHGVSCANVLNTGLVNRHIIYSDPELTNDGIIRSRKLSDNLIEKINELWGTNPYTIGSSNMIRAQETAYYMLAEKTGKKINIFPHLSEKGITLDNIGYSKTKQIEILNKRNPKIIEFLSNNIDKRDQQNIFNKSDWKSFIDWANNNTGYFEHGLDGEYRIVIFTHSDFLRSIFKLPKNKKVQNNGVVHTVFNSGDDINNLNFSYFNFEEIDIQLTHTCPDNCRMTSCKK